MTISRQLALALAISTTLLLSACSSTDLDHFLASGPGNWSSAGSSSSTQSGGTQGPRRCYQTSSTHQTCFD